MKTSDNGIDLIKRFEGCRLEAYRCPSNKFTIGYGHTKGVKQGQVITKQQAEEFLKSDISVFEMGINKLGLNITQSQFDALVSFAFNLGLANLNSSTLLRKIKICSTDLSIVKEFGKWINAGGRKLDGLIKRRNAEAKLYFKDYNSLINIIK